MGLPDRQPGLIRFITGIRLPVLGLAACTIRLKLAT
jgi:hypothetical protein